MEAVQEQRQETEAGSGSEASSTGSSAFGSSALRPLSYKAASARLSYKAATARMSPSPDSPDARGIAAAGLQGSGSAPDPGLSGQFLRSTGVDVSHASVHTGPAADAACQQLGAEAYTLGSSVALSSGTSDHTQMHELAHVAQQSGTPGVAQGFGSPALVPSGNLEAEADAVADAALAGRPASVSVGQAPSVARKPKKDAKEPANVTSEGLSGGAYWDNEMEWAERAHAPEMKRIRDLLAGKTYDEEAGKVMRILSHWDNATIAATWLLFQKQFPGDDWLGDILGNVTLEHLKQFPREMMATLRAATIDQKWKMLWNFTSTGWFDDISEEEAFYCYLLMKELPQPLVQRFYRDFSDRAAELHAKLDPTQAEAMIQRGVGSQKEEWQRRETEVKKRQGIAAEDAHFDRVLGEEWYKTNLLKPLCDAIVERMDDSDHAFDILDALVSTFQRDRSGGELAYVARQMELRGDVDEWLENLGTGFLGAKSVRVKAFLHFLKHRPPEAAIETIEDLVSSGWFDSVSKEEARLAYEIIRQQPLTVQQRFREMNNGALLEAMDDNLGKEVALDKHQYTLDNKGELTEGHFGTASNERERSQQEAADKALTGSKAAWGAFAAMVEALDKEVNADTAKSAFETLAGQSVQIRQAMTRRLDATGKLEAILETLGHDYLWQKPLARTTLSILTARDPMRSVAHIQHLLEDGWVDLLIFTISGTSAEEAYLAKKLLKALPEAYRTKFLARNPTWWGKVMGEQTEGMRQEDDDNTYSGGKDQADRRSILSQLTHDALWEGTTPEALGQLENVARMAMAAGHRQAVFDQASSRKKLSGPHGAVLQGLGLIDAQGAFCEDSTFDETLEGPDRPGKGSAIAGIVLGGHLREGDFTDIKARDIALNDVLGIMGPAYDGMKLTELSEEDQAKGVNTIDADLQRKAGVLEVRIPGLKFDEVALQLGEHKLETGAFTTGSVWLKATYPTETNRSQVASLSAIVRDVGVHDVLLASTDGMLAVQRLAFDKLVLSMDELPDLAKGMQTPEQAQEALERLMPTESIISWLGDVLTFYWATSMVPKAIEGMANAAQGPMLSGPGGTEMHLRGLVLEGVTTSGGARADKIKQTGDIDLYADNLPSEHMKRKLEMLRQRHHRTLTRVRTLLAKPALEGLEASELKRLQSEGPQLEQKIDALLAEIPKQEALDKEYLKLYLKQKRGEVLEPAEAKRLTELREDHQVGVTAYIDGLQATGVGMGPGQAKGEINVTHVTASGQTGALSIGALTDPTLAAQLSGAQKPDAPLLSGGDLAVEHVSASNVAVGAGEVPDYEGIAKDRAVLKASFDEDPDKLSPEEVKRLCHLETLWATKVSDGRTFGQVATRLVEIGATDPYQLELDDALMTEREALLNLLRDPALVVGSLDLRGIRATAERADAKLATEDARDLPEGQDPTTSGTAGADIDFSVGEAQVGKVTKGGETIIEKATASDISGGGVIDVMLGQDGRHGNVSASARAGTLHVEAGDGTTLDATAVRVSADTTGGGMVGLYVDGELTVSGLDMKAKIDELRAERDALKAMEAPSKVHTHRLAQVEETIHRFEKELPGLITKQKAKVDGLAAKVKRTPKSKRGPVEAELAKEKAALAALEKEQQDLGSKPKVGGDGQAAFTVSGAKIEAQGVGNFLDSDWDPTGKQIELTAGFTALEVGALNMSGPVSGVSFDKASASGFSVSVKGTVTKAGDGKASVGGYSFQPDKLVQLDLGSASCTNLKLSTPIGSEQVVIQVPTGSIGGLHASNIPLSGEIDPLTVAGHASLGSANVQLKASVGNYFKAGGTLKLTERMSVTAFDSGKVVFNPGNLSLEGFGFEADGNVRPGSIVEMLKGQSGANISLKQLTAKQLELDRKSGKLEVNGRLGELSTGQMHLGGSGTALDVNGNTSLAGVHVRATVLLNKKRLHAMLRGEELSKEEQDKTPWVDDFHIYRLHFDHIGGSGIHYHSPGRKTQLDLASGFLKNVTLTNFAPNKKSFGLETGKGEVNGLKLVKDNLEVSNLHAEVGSIHVDAYDDGKTTYQLLGTKIHSGHVEQDGLVADFDTKDGRGVTQANDIKATTQEIKDGLIISDVDLGSYHLPKVSYTAPGMTVGARSGARLKGLKLTKATLKYGPKKGGAKGEKELVSIRVQGLHMDELNAYQLHYEGEAKDEYGQSEKTTVLVQSAKMVDFNVVDLSRNLLDGTGVTKANFKRGDLVGLNATLKKAAGTTQLLGNLNAKGFTCDLHAKAYKKGNKEWVQTRGKASLDSFGLTNFTLLQDGKENIKSTPTGGIGGEGGTVDGAYKKGLEVELGSKEMTITSGKLTATGVSFMNEAGTISTEKLAAMGAKLYFKNGGGLDRVWLPKITIGDKKKGLDGFDYNDPSGCISAGIKTGSANDIWIFFKEDGSPKNLSTKTINVQSGSYRVLPSAGAPKPSKSKGPSPNMDFLDGVGGDVFIDLSWSALGGFVGNDESLHIKIKDGKFNAKRVEGQLGTLADMAVGFRHDKLGKWDRLLLDIGGTIGATYVDSFEAMQYNKHGLLKLQTLLKQVDAYRTAAAAELAKKREEIRRKEEMDALKGEDGMCEPESEVVKLPPDKINVRGVLTMKPGTDIKVPGAGKVTVGKPKSGGNVLKFSMNAASAVDVDLMQAALRGVDWKTSTMHLLTGNVNARHLTAHYDINNGIIQGKLMNATIDWVTLDF